MASLKSAAALFLVLTLVKVNEGYRPYWGHNHIDKDLSGSASTCISNCRQSPINITKNLNSVFSKPLIFNDDYCKSAKKIDMHSDGHSIVLKFLGIEPEIMSGPLKDTYKLHSVHFHWGEDDHSGSEHTINGFSYPMELHAVHTKNGVDLPTAQLDPSGIVVIGYFFEIKPSEYTKAMRYITQNLKYLSPTKTSTTLNRRFELSDLLMPFHDGFVSYEGSLTTAPFSEAVIWILSPYTIKITPDEMAAFRALSLTDVVHEEENFRETQPLNGRKVNYNFLENAPTTVTGCSAVNAYWFENIFSSLLLSQ